MLNQHELNQMKADNALIPLTIKIQTKKYRALMELALKTGIESSKFISGEIVCVDCNICPVEKKDAFCGYMDVMKEFIEMSEMSERLCYGNFMQFLFSEKNKDETYNALMKNLNEALTKLGEKIKPKVYEYGFLLKEDGKE